MTPAQLDQYAFDVVGIAVNVPNMKQTQPLFVSPRGQELFAAVADMRAFRPYFAQMDARAAYYNTCLAAMELCKREGAAWADPVTTSNTARNRMLNEMRGMRVAMMMEVNQAGFLQENELNRTKASVDAFIIEGGLGVSCAAPFADIRSQDAKKSLREMIRNYDGLIDRGRSTVIFEAVRFLTMGLRINRFGYLEFHYDFTMPIEYVPAHFMEPVPRTEDLAAEFAAMWRDVMGVFQFRAPRGKYGYI